MTLKSRNRLLVAFIIFSSLIFILSAVRLALSIYNGTILIPENLARPLSIKLPNNWLFNYNFYASASGIMLFFLYSIFITIFVFFYFEKTQAIEIIYFMAFVIGCLLEGCRIFVPTENLWKPTSMILAIISRIIITGRMAASFGLLFSALFNEVEQRQYVERNFVILFMLSILIGKMYPISTMEILTTYTTQIGEKVLFSVFEHVLMISTLLIITYEGISNHLENISNQVIGCALIIIGHKLLCGADCYITVALGITSLTAGSLVYLKYLHSIYLWK